MSCTIFHRRALALGAAGYMTLTLSACDDPLRDPAVVDSTRIVAAKVFIEDGAVAEPAPGEAFEFELRVLSNRPRSLAATVVLCEIEPTTLGEPVCVSRNVEPKHLVGDTLEPLRGSFVLPGRLRVGEHWAVIGAVCDGRYEPPIGPEVPDGGLAEPSSSDAGAPDPSAEAGVPEPSAGDEANPQGISHVEPPELLDVWEVYPEQRFECPDSDVKEFFVRRIVPEADPNHNPELSDDELRFDGKRWLEGDTALAPGQSCAQLDVPQLKVGREAQIEFRMLTDDREELEVDPNEYGALDRETLRFSQMASSEGLDRPYASINADDDELGFETSFKVEDDFDAPRQGMLVAYTLVGRDHRGGVDFTERQFCVVP